MRRPEFQTSLFPELPRPALKPEPAPLEKDFMRQVKDLAEKMGLPSVHIENYCGNKFFVECPICGNKTLATCRKRNNTGNAGTPDLIGIEWAIELKRDRNQRGEAFEPSIRQKSQMEKLSGLGVPVMVASPGNINEAINFLKNIQKGNSHE